MRQNDELNSLHNKLRLYLEYVFYIYINKSSKIKVTFDTPKL